MLKTDEELLRDFNGAGSQEAFAEIYKRHARSITEYLSLRYFKRDEASAEDAVQQTFLKLSQQAASLDLDEPLQPWLFSVASHCAIDIQRARGRRPAVSLSELGVNGVSTSLSCGERFDFDPAADDGTAYDELALAEDRAEVRQEFADLPDEDREAVEAVYFDGMSFTDAATHLGIPAGSLKTRVHRSLRRMRCRIDGRRQAA